MRYGNSNYMIKQSFTQWLRWVEHYTKIMGYESKK